MPITSPLKPSHTHLSIPSVHIAMAGELDTYDIDIGEEVLRDIEEAEFLQGPNAPPSMLQPIINALPVERIELTETADDVTRAVRNLLADTDDYEGTTLRKFRRKLARRMGLEKDGLDHKADEINALVREELEKKRSGLLQVRFAEVLAELGEEDPRKKELVYLVTISRALPATLSTTDLRDISVMSRLEVMEAVRAAFDNPVAGPCGGRPRTRQDSIVKKLVVFRESHADGSVHFHVAVLLHQPRSWSAAKRALRVRERLPSHFSCAHTQWWSAVRYGAVPTLKKPVVDEAPEKYPQDVDLFAESQRPWNAGMWKRRREEAEKQALAGCGKRRRFCKLDLTSIILDKGLNTKAAVLEYTQDHGTEEMQLFVHNHQKYLKDFLTDAQEWDEARGAAAAERETDWALICRTASDPCSEGSSCGYAKAAAFLFEANIDHFSQEELAVSIRTIIMQGPSKTSRTPIIVGPTNSGKSTLVLPFDKVFGFHRVFHKPALGSAFALRNILKEKRFLFWDDYRPVEYAQKTLPVTTFLSLFQGQPFEVQVSQSFNDGNIDFEWRRGAIMTAKERDLWKTCGEVDEEDVRHMQSRLLVFRCKAAVAKLKDITPCAQCMCSWLCNACGRYDVRPLVHLPIANVRKHGGEPEDDAGKFHVPGMLAFVEKARLPVASALHLQAQIVDLGALHVDELNVEDWRSLEGFASLRPLERRRILASLVA